MAFSFLALIPSLISTVISGAAAYSEIKANNEQANQIAEQAQEQANERMKNAKKLMQQQKTSFLKGGVYFDTGSANSVINETYDTAVKDVQGISKDATNKQKALMSKNMSALIGGAGNIVKSSIQAYGAYSSSNDRTTDGSGNDTTISGDTAGSNTGTGGGVRGKLKLPKITLPFPKL